jgi:hypothetical protein
MLCCPEHLFPNTPRKPLPGGREVQHYPLTARPSDRGRRNRFWFVVTAIASAATAANYAAAIVSGNAAAITTASAAANANDTAAAITATSAAAIVNGTATAVLGDLGGAGGGADARGRHFETGSRYLF